MGISSVERETGLSKDTLRMWERRYAFPQPLRDANGERVYPADQVEKLRLLKRLMDRGHRPGKIIARSLTELTALGEELAAEAPRPEIEVMLRLIKAHELLELRRHLGQALARQGLQAFVLDTIAPLTEAVGTAWTRGYLAVFEEHLYTELMQGFLRSAIAGVHQPGGTPRVLLTTLPSELHGLGLLMVEALLALDGAACISLGTETPAREIGEAAEAQRIDIVALSFSGAYPEAKAADALKELRALLPEAVTLVAGGSGTARLRRPIEGVRISSDLRLMSEMIQHWRSSRVFH
jgi:DNA-binding transcriptional MerR regulator/methylmalonyl-CoA mutase cobalamin-binding subunit